jgi:hypothetical protein
MGTTAGKCKGPVAASFPRSTPKSYLCKVGGLGNIGLVKQLSPGLGLQQSTSQKPTSVRGGSSPLCW